MQLQLANTIVRSMTFREVEENKEIDNNLEFKSSVIWDKESESKSFGVLLSVLLEDSSGYELIMEFEGIFNTDTIIDEAFCESPWAHVNGPAIVFPFLRAFVSNITINSGHSPAILPSINFQRIYNDGKNEVHKTKELPET
jgi:preprotein translocase subunit SecB